MTVNLVLEQMAAVVCISLTQPLINNNPSHSLIYIFDEYHSTVEARADAVQGNRKPLKLNIELQLSCQFCFICTS